MTTLAPILAAVAACLGGQPEPADLHARPSLVAETGAAAPGETLWLALTFEIDPGWHTYWPGQNDSGLPLDAEFRASENAEVGEPLWPAPTRYSPAEGILDHVYHERMTVLVPVGVSESAQSGDTVRVEADLRWLVCEKICLAESAVVSAAVPVESVTPGVDTAHAALFREARARLPRPPEPEDNIRIACAGDVLRVQAQGSARIALYPLEESRRARTLIDTGLAEGDSLEIEFRPGDDPIRGVLEVWRSPEGPSTVFEIEWPDPRAREEVGAGG